MKLGFLNLNITVVGLGLIGGSMAMALKELNPNRLWAIDKNLDTINIAEKINLVDKAYTTGEIPLKQSDIVVIALYPEACVEFIKNNINNFKEGAIITDTGGIKDKLIKKIKSIIPDTIDFIGGHPMAGLEGQGFKQASKEIFQGSTYILTPVESNKRHNVEAIKQMAVMIGCRSVVELSPREHDEIIALTSQVPHIIAAALVQSSNVNYKVCSMIGGSYKSATRVANINSELWSELFIENNKNIVKKLDEFEEKIKFIKEGIINNDKEGIKKILDEVNIKRKELY